MRTKEHALRSPQNLALRSAGSVHLRALNQRLNLLLLFVVGIGLEQQFPRDDRTLGVLLALPLYNSHVEKRSGMVRPDGQRLVKVCKRLIRISAVPV